MTAIIYEALNSARDEVRFLTIDFAQNDHSTISCRLHTSSLSAVPGPKFFAISYVWGDPSMTEDILVNGHRFAATTNLVSALRHIRTIMLDSLSSEAKKPG
jgi:heterokaryon incompatibility protein (HET)